MVRKDKSTDEKRKGDKGAGTQDAVSSSWGSCRLWGFQRRPRLPPGSPLKTLSPNAKSTVPHFKAVTCDEAIIDNDGKTFKVTKLLKGEIHAFCKCYSLIS